MKVSKALQKTDSTSLERGWICFKSLCDVSEDQKNKDTQTLLMVTVDIIERVGWVNWKPDLHLLHM